MERGTGSCRQIIKMENKKTFETPDLSIKELSHALYEANQALSETIRQRNEFFANISHDLRSPITAIHNCIEYLQSLDRITEDDIKDVLPLLSSRSAMLEHMINDIFLLTKLDCSEDMLHFGKVPVDAFLEDFFFMYEVDEQYSDRELLLDISDNCDTVISMDAPYMKRALDNIMKNALAHTSKGDTISLSAHSIGSYIEIIIANTGEKISQKDLPHIFERSYMSSDSRTPDKNHGAGLGLSICKSIIEKHGGSISAHSIESSDRGCEFHIQLPRS